LWAGAALGLFARPGYSAELLRVSIAVPGPGNLLFLPITLAGKLGADRQEGLEFNIKYMSGGPQAFKDMLDRNVDFSAGGFAALGLQRASGHAVRSVLPITRVPAYTLLVRNDLKGKVKRVADLRGKVVGVKGHSPGGRSTSQLFTEFVLARAGVATGNVNYVSVGQSFESQHAGLASSAVDAIMGDEPFATRLVKDGVAFALRDFHDLAATRELLGGLFLNGMLATREDVVANRPEVVEKVVKAIKRSLTWIDQQSADAMVDALQMPDAVERDALRAVLKVRKTIYSTDGRFSDEQVASTNRFFHATETSASAKALQLASLVEARWAGRAA
jgi:NitT/TauT family transport system substrate-binding protein